MAETEDEPIDDICKCCSGGSTWECDCELEYRDVTNEYGTIEREYCITHNRWTE